MISTQNNLAVTANAVEIATQVLQQFVGRQIDGKDVKDIEEIFAAEFNNAITEKIDATR